MGWRVWQCLNPGLAGLTFEWRGSWAENPSTSACLPTAHRPPTTRRHLRAEYQPGRQAGRAFLRRATIDLQAPDGALLLL